MSTGEPDATETGHVRFGGGPSEKALPSRDLAGGLPDRPSRSGKGPTEKDPHHGHLVGGLLHAAGGPGKTHREQSRQGAPVRPNPSRKRAQSPWYGRVGVGWFWLAWGGPGSG